MNNAERFKTLYTGLDRAYGIYGKDRGKTVRKPVGIEHYEQHLEGKKALGIVPINDDAKCHFGAIDIDIDDINHKALARQVMALNAPLIVCRSKSGGSHLYTFSKKGIKAATLRTQLSAWATQMGYGRSEIFPKQDKIGSNDVGNWINLPYFSADTTGRMAFDNEGQELSLEEFLDLAEEVAASEAASGDGETLPTMPPCLSYYMSNSIDQGMRNEVMYNFGVYFKQSDPLDWEESLYAHNFKHLDKPLPRAEIAEIIKSLGKKTYGYKCDIPAMVDVCNKTMCNRAVFGKKIGGADYFELQLGRIAKLQMDDPIWLVDINGQDVELTTDDLYDFRRVRKKITDVLNVIPPPVKNEDWMQMLIAKMDSVLVIEAPSDASYRGQLEQLFIEFSQVAKQGSGMEEVTRGIPVLTTNGSEEEIIAFRGQDFINFLKRRKLRIDSTTTLWNDMRGIGCKHRGFRIQGTVKQLWYIPYSKDGDLPKVRYNVDETEI